MSGELGLGPVASSASTPTPVTGLTVGSTSQLLLLDGIMNYYGNYYGFSSCTPLAVMGTSGAAALGRAFVSDTTINLSISGDPGLHTYSDSACTVQSSSVVIPAGNVSAIMYFMNPQYINPTGCGTSPNATISAQSQDGTLSSAAPLDVDFAASGGCGC